MKRLAVLIPAALCLWLAAAAPQKPPVLVSVQSSTPPDFGRTTVKPLVTVYDGTANIAHPLMPHLRTLAGTPGAETYTFDLFACDELARYLKAQKVDRACFDWEPNDSGAKEGYTERTTLIALAVIDAFARAGVTLEIFPFPDGTPAADPIAARTKTLHHDGYPFTASAEAYSASRYRQLLSVKRRYPANRHAVWITPWSQGRSGDGKPPVPAFTFDAELFRTYRQVGNLSADEIVIWVSRIRDDGTDYLPWKDLSGAWWAEVAAENPK